MTLPTQYGTATVTGQFIDSENGTPAAGTVEFVPAPCYLIDAEGDLIVISDPVTVTLDDTGAFSVALLSTDDPDLNPNGWTYSVIVRLVDPVRVRSFSIEAPEGTTVDLADAVPVDGSLGNAVVVGPPGQPGPVGPMGPQGVPGGPWLRLTQAQFDALDPKDPNTLYVILG